MFREQRRLETEKCVADGSGLRQAELFAGFRRRARATQEADAAAQAPAAGGVCIHCVLPNDTCHFRLIVVEATVFLDVDGNGCGAGCARGIDACARARQACDRQCIDRAHGVDRTAGQRHADTGVERAEWIAAEPLFLRHHRVQLHERGERVCVECWCRGRCGTQPVCQYLCIGGARWLRRGANALFERKLRAQAREPFKNLGLRVRSGWWVRKDHSLIGKDGMTQVCGTNRVHAIHRRPRGYPGKQRDG